MVKPWTSDQLRAIAAACSSDKRVQRLAGERRLKAGLLAAGADRVRQALK